MSRRSKRTLNRAIPISLPGGSYYTPAQAQQSPYNQTFYGSKTNFPVGQQAIFSPGSPLPAQSGTNPLGQPIQYKYMPSWNSFPPDRASNNPDIPSFQQLRNLAKLSNAVGICERVWMDMVPRMELKISLKPEYVAGGADEKDYQPEISYFRTWFESPDKMHDMHSWIRLCLREQTQIDELYLYKRKKRGGGLYSMEVISGDQMKPLLDDWGKIPQPPAYAFQQYPWGIPGAWFRTDEMIHYQESPAADNPYGQSRIERIILLINQALRKQNKDLKHFTEGNMPQGLMMPPETADWTPDQIDAFEQSWNSLLAGNSTQQVRMRFTQPGMKFQALEDYKLDPTFDKYILNIAVASYGMSMQDVAFVEDIHKSSGDSQENMTYRRTIDPLAIVYSSFITQAINTDFDPDLHGEMFQASFTGFDEEEDVSILATAYSALTSAGILGLSNASKLLKLPDDPNAPYIGRVFMSATGPIFLDDMASDKMRNAAMNAQLTALQQGKTAAKPPQGNEPASPPEEAQPAQPGQQEKAPATTPAKPQAKATTPASTTTAKRAVASKDEDEEEDSPEVEDEEADEEEGILPDEDEDEEDYDELTPEDEEQEDEISFHLTSDTEAPYSDLERYYAEGYIPEYFDDENELIELLERHTPGGHDHDQKTHGDFAHPAYGAKHDTTPANKTAMAATAKPTPKLAAAQAKVTSATAAVKSAQAALHSAAKADKPAARATLKTAHATLKTAKAAVHTLNEQAKAQRKQVAAQAKAAKAKTTAAAKAEKATAKAAKAKTTAQAKEAKADAKAKAQATAAKVKQQKAQAKEKAAKVAAQKKTLVAQAKAQALKAHIAKLATAATAKTARMATVAQAKAQAQAVKAAKTQAKAGSTQAHVQLKTAKAQQVAAKKLQTLTSTIGAKANLYNALSGRKISATWTAQDSSNAASIASDLHSLLESVNSHVDESNVTGLAKNLAQSISSLSARKGISQAGASVLQKLSVSAQQQLSRALLGVDLYDEYEVDDDEVAEEYEGVLFDDDEIDEPTEEEERRYTIGELLQLLQQQMQEKATDQTHGEDFERPEERSMVTATDSRPTTDDRAISAEYRRWKDRAIDDVKGNRQPRGFTTTLIPETIHRWISDELAACSSVEDVRDIFSQARAMSTQQDEPTMTGKNDLAKSVHSVFQQVAQRGHKAVVALEGE
jgi:hypothetical protein